MQLGFQHFPGVSWLILPDLGYSSYFVVKGGIKRQNLFPEDWVQIHRSPFPELPDKI